MFSLASSTPLSHPISSTMSKEDLDAKAKEINLVLSEPDVDLWRLRELSLTEGGLVNDTLRKRAWPKLVGLHNDRDDTASGVVTDNAPNTRSKSAAEQHATHKQLTYQQVPYCVDAEQIERDVARCTWHLLTGSQRSRRLQMENKHRHKVHALLKKKQKRLGNLINLTLLETNGDLRYYQGYHDVASIFLHTLGGGGSGPMPLSPEQALAASMGLDLPSRVLLQVSRSHLRDAMRSNFHELQVALRLILFPLICAVDPQVHDHLYDCDMEPFFALSWVITWFAHDVRDTNLVKRLFDALLVSHPLFIIYMSVAMVVHPVNRMDVLQTDCDFASVHQTLVGLPKNSSVVGWSYHPVEVDGSMSGDAGEDDASISTTEMDGRSITSDEVLEGHYFGEESASQGSASLLSLSQHGDSPRVPFQEIIDLALSYMRRVPPRKLLSLSKRYFAEESIRPMLAQCNSIALLKPPPSWGLASTTPADWVLKQRARESRGLKATNRRDRRNRSKNEAGKKEQDELDRYLEEKKKTLAVIASGIGRADDEEEERRKKRRKLMVYSGVALGLVALSCVVVMQYRATVAVGGPPQSDVKLSQRSMVAKDKRGTTPPKQTSVKRPETTGQSQSKQSFHGKQDLAVRLTTSEGATQAKAKTSEKIMPSVESKTKSSSPETSSASIEAATTDIVRSERSTMAERLERSAGLFLVNISAKLGPAVRVVKENVLLPGARAVRDLRGVFSEPGIPKVPGFQRLCRFSGEVLHAVRDRDLRKLPGSPKLGSVAGTLDATRAVKDSDALKIPGSAVARSLVHTARAALAENDCEVVAL